MPLAKLNCLTFVGIKPVPVTIEVHISSGLPSFAIVGLADTEIRESKERVRSALLNSGFEFPSQRITVNLAPADLPKGSASFDLAIALGIASASGQLNGARLDPWLFAGELSLSGQLVATRSPFALAVAARRECLRQTGNLQLMMPLGDAKRVCSVPDISIFGAPTLFAAASHLVGHGDPLLPMQPGTAAESDPPHVPDMADVVGHESAKHALLVAAAGKHHIRLVGPPGSGKSMLAKRMAGLLPQHPFEQALELSAIKSLKNESHGISRQRPFRNPHPSTSMAALIGGGNPPSPGEITLAHQGVLFTDEVLEFDRRSLEALREPLETGQVHVSRAGRQASFPAQFLWVCAHNPCPCGWLGHPQKACYCTEQQIRKYQAKLSGPLSDRLDISIEVNPVQPGQLLDKAQPGPTTRDLLKRVIQSRNRQFKRQNCLNGEMATGLIQHHCKPEPEAEKLLLSYAHKNHLSSRAIHRICKVARTLADLDEAETIKRQHIATALQFRKNLNLATSPSPSNWST
ncbi:MAG: YifB family Mg chelatase-like AAA ATPase [Limnobacter sp.]|nr:YifB family Mg chelatase-like AAA ATPase [Limnobacter sp.]